MRRGVNRLLNYFGAAPDSMGDLVKNEVRLLESPVLGSTNQSLSCIRERFHATARGDSSLGGFPEAYPPDLRLVVRK